MNSREIMSFAGGDLPVPQPTRAELVASADAWVATARQTLSGFIELADAGDRVGCKAAIKAFTASAQMTADRMLELVP